jgi:hypothetical protein
MLQPIHAEIIRQALGQQFGPDALEAILKANLGQDALQGQFGHDEYHFDNNAFELSRAYIEGQRGLVFSALQAGDAQGAHAAFGRLTHSAQDFYAHSNYVDLWLAGRPNSVPRDIDPVDPRWITSPELYSGKLYYPQEILYFIPGLRRLALSFLPRDSHAHMNLDSAERGPKFEYAFTAAVKRTEWEFEQLRSQLSEESLALFTGIVIREDAKTTKGMQRDSSQPACVLRFTFFVSVLSSHAS